MCLVCPVLIGCHFRQSNAKVIELQKYGVAFTHIDLSIEEKIKCKFSVRGGGGGGHTVPPGDDNL